MKVLYIFDFDGTLFRSPYPPKGWNKSEDEWWRTVGSLNPPCVPEKPNNEWWNMDVVAAAKRAISDKEGVAVILTGRRMELFKKRMYQLLSQKNLDFENIFMKGDTATLGYKMEIMRKMIDKYHSEKVVIWDDRKAHLTKMAEMVRSLGLESEEHYVADNPKQIACTFGQFLKANPTRSKDKFSKRMYNTG